jgi:GNAT superfamily N-acetyltransferase
MELRRLDPARDVEVLQSILEGAPDYIRRASGREVRPTDGLAEFKDLPPGKAASDKYTFALVEDGAVVGCLDVLRGYPNPATAYVGLLLITEQHQGRGLGASAWRCFEAHCARWAEIAVLRLAVVETNREAAPFWETMGFRATGEVRPYRTEDLVTHAHLFEKRLR